VRLDGKVAVVTGAGTGIGQAIAVAFAMEGASVVVDYVGNASISADTLTKIQAMKGNALGVDADISLPEDVDRLIRETINRFGKLNIFVNNAGIEKKFAFVDFPFEEWQKIVAVNLTGPFLCCQAAAKQMILQGKGGRIINISSSTKIFQCPPMRLIALRRVACECSREQLPSNWLVIRSR
jgi:glucose 1-dehydrogenase